MGGLNSPILSPNFPLQCSLICLSVLHILLLPVPIYRVGQCTSATGSVALYVTAFCLITYAHLPENECAPVPGLWASPLVFQFLLLQVPFHFFPFQVFPTRQRMRQLLQDILLAQSGLRAHTQLTIGWLYCHSHLLASYSSASVMFPSFFCCLFLC